VHSTSYSTVNDIKCSGVRSAYKEALITLKYSDVTMVERF